LSNLKSISQSKSTTAKRQPKNLHTFIFKHKHGFELSVLQKTNCARLMDYACLPKKIYVSTTLDDISVVIEMSLLDYVGAFGEWILANLDKMIL
jgi:hypothetical protein